MALTQTQMRSKPISLKSRGKKRSHDEVDYSPKTTPAALGDARARGIILAFVDKAFANFKKGERREYNELVAQFQSDHGPAAQADLLKSWLEALTQSVSQFDKKHASLAEAIIDLPWAAYDDAFVRIYVRFICVLAAARPEYLRRVLDKAVKAFRWHSHYQLATDANANLTKRELYSRVHYLIKTLLQVVPTAPSTLLPLLERNFPPQRERKEAQIVYYTNVLKIMEYVPHLTQGILEMVVAKAIKIDVEIQVDIEDLEEYEGALDDAVFGYTAEDPFNKRLGDEDSSDDSDNDGDTLLPFDFDDLSSEEGDHSDDDNTLGGLEEKIDPLDNPKVVAQIKDMVAKLDAILKVIFSAFESINRSTSPPRFGFSRPLPAKITPTSTPIDGEIQRRAIFDALLLAFDHVILKTFKTRHTQFLLFWYSSLHPDFNDSFTATLINTALYDDARPAVNRISASSYLASYISRAKFVSAQNTQIAVGLLCEWLEHEFTRHAPSPASSIQSLADVPPKSMRARQLAVFYAVFQATIYIFCYRWKDLCLTDDRKDEDEEVMQPAELVRRWLPQMSIVKEIIFSHLNPLKFCSANVTKQFVRIAHHVNFAYCFTVLERNKQRRRMSFSSDDCTPVPSRNVSIAPLEDGSHEPTEIAVSSMLEEARIETHFPFDPYKLPLTCRYIEGIFKEFEAPEGMNDEEEDDASVAEEDEGMAQPSSFSTEPDEGFSTSFDEQMALGGA